MGRDNCICSHAEQFLPCFLESSVKLLHRFQGKLGCKSCSKTSRFIEVAGWKNRIPLADLFDACLKMYKCYDQILEKRRERLYFSEALPNVEESHMKDHSSTQIHRHYWPLLVWLYGILQFHMRWAQYAIFTLLEWSLFLFFTCCCCLHYC